MFYFAAFNIIFLSLYASITSDDCHAWFHLSTASPATLRGTGSNWTLQKNLSMVGFEPPTPQASRIQVHCHNHSATTRLIWEGRATDKARKSVITHWKSLKTHWKYKLGVKIRISILRYALGVQCSAYWLLIHVLKKSKTLDCRCQSVCPFVVILSKYGQYNTQV